MANWHEICSTWGINLRVNNETETIGQAAQLVSLDLNQRKDAVNIFIPLHAFQYDTFYGSKKQQLSKVKLKLIEIGNEVSRVTLN
jgi:hypothetical protein